MDSGGGEGGEAEGQEEAYDDESGQLGVEHCGEVLLNIRQGCGPICLGVKVIKALVSSRVVPLQVWWHVTPLWYVVRFPALRVHTY